MTLWDIEHEYPEDYEDVRVLCEQCPFRIRIRTPKIEDSDRPLLDQLTALRIDYSTLERIPDPIARQEQVMLIMGYNKAIEDATKLIVRNGPQEEERRNFVKALYGAGE